MSLATSRRNAASPHRSLPSPLGRRVILFDPGVFLFQCVGLYSNGAIFNKLTARLLLSRLFFIAAQPFDRRT